MWTRIIPTYLLLLLCSSLFGQFNQYGYRREILGVKDQWHKIVLPNEIFGKVETDLSDIRIFGFTTKHDTIEAPYILRLTTEKISQKDVVFNLINQSKNDKGYYFTFEMPSEGVVNQLNLEFKQQNFDWRLTLEGSQNQREWFSITEDYRILSIKNESTDFHFTKVTFPGSRYHYLRLRVDSEIKPEIRYAKISLNEVVEGEFEKYIINSTRVEECKQNKQTIINVDMKSPVPVCKLKICIKDTFDFYRPVTIKYLTDSVKTQQGWKDNYSTLTSATLNSFERNEFKFNNTILRRLIIIIENQDNQSLKIDSIVVEGYIHELMARFIEPATYFLTYDNHHAIKPHYDIDRFTDKIPISLTALKLGAEQSIEKEVVIKTTPLFQNKIWLWTIMGIIIVTLGWFSIQMLNKK
jgi:hypothetical protein